MLLLLLLLLQVGQTIRLKTLLQSVSATKLLFLFLQLLLLPLLLLLQSFESSLRVITNVALLATQSSFYSTSQPMEQMYVSHVGENVYVYVCCCVYACGYMYLYIKCADKTSSSHRLKSVSNERSPKIKAVGRVCVKEESYVGQRFYQNISFEASKIDGRFLSTMMMMMTMTLTMTITMTVRVMVMVTINIFNLKKFCFE